MADINLSFQADGGISLDDALGIFTGTSDPSLGAGEEAPLGSLWIRQNGQLFQKVGPLDTDWIPFATGIGQAVKISATDTTAGYLNFKLLVTSNLTKTLADVGLNETLILDLSNTGVSTGSYTRVTVDEKGRVTAGANPVTLSGYGIVDAQPLAANLTALAGVTTTGIYVRQTAGGTTITRTINGTTNQVNVLSGDGVSGNPTLSFSSTILFPGTTGIRPPSGTTAQRVATAPYTRFNTDTSHLEYFNGTVWVELVASTGGTVTSVATAQPAAGLTITGSPITTSGTLTFALADDLAAVEGLATTGIAVRTAADTWATRTLAGTADRLSVINGDGVAGAPTFDISSTYAGQTSITTLGTITTGTWQGSTLATAFGGTGRTTIGTSNQLLGVNTTATGLEYKTLSNGTGISLSFSGGGIIVGNTGVTSLTGTVNQVNLSGATGAISIGLPQAIATTSTPTFSTLTLTGAVTAATQAATKAYVDGLVQGLSTKNSVRVATTANITLSGTQTIDGVAVAAGNRVLVKNQTTPSQNGIYLVAAGAWTRALDMDNWTEVPSAFTFVQEGTTQAETGWVVTADATGTIGTTAMPWVQFSSAGIVLAGTGLTKTGNTLSITDTGVIAGAGYNVFTVNAQGQITAASTAAYLTGNQTITLQGDTTGSGTTLITTTLSNTGVVAGSYTRVTVDAKGRVTAANNPTTLAGYGITDAQPLDADLTAIAAITGTGFAVRTAPNQWEQRSIIAASNKVFIVNGDGVDGNVSIDITEANIDINNLDATLQVEKGGTNLSSLGTANQLLGVNAAATGLEYKTLTSSGITITHTANGINFSANTNGTVTSVAVTAGTGISVTGSPITSSGTINLALDNELVGLTLPTGLGLVARTAVGTYAERTIVSGVGTIAITNPAGTSGNIGLDLQNIGTPGAYYQVTTDTFGRVLSGTTSVDWSAITATPTTLSGYGIVDAQPLNSFLTSVGGNVNTGIVVKNGATSLVRSIVAGSPKITVTNGNGVAGNPSVDLGSVALGDLSNVSVVTPVTGQSLVYNGTIWTASSVTPKLYAENAVAEVTPVSTGTNAIALGSAATAEAHDSLAFGPQSLSRLPGIVQANGRFATQGDAQHGTYILRTGTINALPADLFLDGTNGSERLTLTTDTTWVWKATVLAHRTDADDHAGFELRGVVYCGGSLNSIAILGTVSKTILARSDSSLNATASVDTATGSLKLTVTGATGKTFRWTAVVETTEVTN